MKFKNLEKEIQENPLIFLRGNLFRDNCFYNREKYYFQFSLGNHDMGDASACVFMNRKSVLWTDFYPLRNISGARKKGLGTLTHVLANRKLSDVLVNMYGSLEDCTIHHTGSVSRSRRKQLKKMGIDIYTTYEMKEYLRMSEEYARKIGISLAVLPKSKI